MKTKSIEKTTKDSSAEAILKQVAILPYFSVDAIKSSNVADGYVNIILHRLAKRGKIVPLKRGAYVSRMYLDALKKTGDMNNYLEFLVSSLYSPAYVSAEYVLAERGILTEAAYAVTGITKNKTKRFSNELGNFHYRHVKDELFCGFEILRKGEFLVHKATMAKALFDFLYARKHILTDKNAVDELRLNIELLPAKEKKEVREYGKKEGSGKMKTIIEYLFA